MPKNKLIIIVGSHAIGKTTTFRKVFETGPYTISQIYGDRREPVKKNGLIFLPELQGSNEDRRKVMDKCKGYDIVTETALIGICRWIIKNYEHEYDIKVICMTLDEEEHKKRFYNRTNKTGEAADKTWKNITYLHSRFKKCYETHLDINQLEKLLNILIKKSDLE